MKFSADLNYQNRYTVIKSCEIEKTVRLSGEEFDDFSADLLAPQSFIKENKDSMFFDSDRTYHCLLVTGEDRADGILVYSEGHDFASYACHISDAQALLVASRYPSLAEFTNNLVAMADYLVERAMTLKPGKSGAVIGMDELGEVAVDYMAQSKAVGYTLCKML